MKNIILKTTAVLIASASVCSCLTKVEPTEYLSEERLGEIASTDPDKIYSAKLNGMYVDLQQACETNYSHNYFGQKSFDYLSSLMGNDMIMTGRFGMSLYHYLLDFWQQDYAPTSNRWAEYYNHIANANQIIGGIDEETATPNALSYLAQAYTFRGYAYLQLANLYQRCYYVGADDTKWGKGTQYDWSEKPCVPIVTDIITGNQPRSTVKEVYKQITDDLEKAYAIFDQIGAIKTPDPCDMDGCVAANYLARAYMNKHEWEKALTYANIITDNYDYLSDDADILQGFSNADLKDVLLACRITADNTTVYMSFFSQMDMFGAGYAAMAVWRAGFKPFVDKIADDDVRLRWFITSRSTEYSAGKAVDYQSCKFIGAGKTNVVWDDESSCFYGEGWEEGDYIYLRSEEAYFMKAECLAHLNRPTEAISALEEIMTSRQPSYSWTDETKANLIEEINFQKRVEFWGEGIEYLDNRRLNIPIDRTDATWGAANNHFSGAKIAKNQEDRELTYQLPKKEIETNPYINEEDQN